MVNAIDKFQMSWEQVTNEVNTPLFKSLWKNGVVGVTEAFVCDFPGSFDIELFNIEENSEKFNNSHSWMGVVKLASDFFWPIFPFSVLLHHKSSDSICNRGGDQEVLLLKSEFLSCISGVVGIENAGDVFSSLSLFKGSEVVTLVERSKVEFVVGERSPKSQVDGVECVKSWNWVIISSSNDDLSSLPEVKVLVVFTGSSNVSVESNGIVKIKSFNFPWIALVQPEVGGFALITISNELLENTIVVADTISPCR